MKQLFKNIFKWLLIILAVLSAGLLLTGHGYIFKAIYHTYFKGRSGPSADEYKIFENREVKNATEVKWPLSSHYNSQKISENLLKEFEAYQTMSYVVIRGDSLIHEQYWDGTSDSTVLNSFSMAKTFVSILTGIAIAEGKIKSLDQPIGDFLPEYKESKITIRHLLTMSSGINFDEDYVSPFAYPARAYYGSDLRSLTFSYKAEEEPGKIFKYLSGNTMLLNFVLQKATGQTISDYFSEKLWKPLGAKHPAWWSLDHEGGDEKAFCCFNSNAADLARIGQLFLDSGKWNGQQVVPMDYVLESVQPAPLLDTDGKKNEKYGFAWWLIPDYKGLYIYYARGILGQYIICIPEKQLVIVRQGQKREKNAGDNHPKDLYWYIDCALEMYGR